MKTTVIKSLLVIALLCSSFSTINGQSKLKGTVIDSTTSPLIAATIVLLQPVDSVMVSYAITDNQGGFTLNGVKAGTYFLQITYIGYGNYRQEIKVSGTQDTQDLGTIFLSPKNTMLKQVVVKAEHVPIVIKKDTIEYNADAFATKPNAVVEELLKRLPGVEVQRDGSIKAQGEDVENVLVDGKEFFGKDPKIATQNLPAEIVDKVQVYDKKSEMAEFSGVDDGQEEKTINLKLKDGKKKGYFGNISGGFGTEDLDDFLGKERYKSKLNINRFDSKLQFSVLGMANNNNDQGFSFNDYINFTGGMGGLMSGNSMSLSLNSGDLGIPLGYNSASGITQTEAGGINFNYDIGDKIEWQSSYFINRIQNSTIRDTKSENLGNLGNFTKNGHSDRENLNLNHRLNTSLRMDLDTTAQLTWINRLSFNTGDISSLSLNETRSNAVLQNTSENNYTNEGDQFSWSSNLTLRKKLNKPGRILSANFNLNLGEVSDLSFVDNQFAFYENGIPGMSNNILQDQEMDDDQSQYGIRLTYTEPLAKNLFLGINANRSNFKNETVNNYYDLDPNNPSSRILNTQLSNQYLRNYTYNQLGTDLRYVREKVNTSGGLNVQFSDLEGEIISENVLLSKNFTYFLPSFNLEYKIATSKNIDFSYRTSVREPSVEQLQPTINNTDPFSLYQGNPKLKPEYTHSGNIHLMIFDQFNFTSFFANINTRYTTNKIVNTTTIDDQFRQIITPVNSDNDITSSIYASFSTPLRFIKSKISLDANVIFNRGNLFINELKNTTNRWTNNFTFTMENRKKDIVDVAFGLSLGTSNVKYSENEEFNQNYFDQTYFNDLTIYLPKAWTIESSLDYTRYSAESFADEDKQVIWKAGITKGLLKNERLTLKLSVFDILNQNQGIRRSNSLNYIQESRTNVLGRYGMLTINFKLSQFGGGGAFIIDEGRR